MKITSYITSIILSVSILPMVSGCSDDQPQYTSLTSFDLRSEATGSSYQVKVLYPDNFDPSRSYETIYLLDGDWYFDELSEIVHKEQRAGTVLVSIGGSGLRNRDFTYPADGLLKKSGGAREYVRFLATELVPYVEDELGIQSTNRALLGHSLGGYLALYMVFQEETKNPFTDVVAVSPSLYWSDGYIFKLEQQYASQSARLDLSLYVGMGDLEGVTMNTFFDAFTKKVTSRNYEGVHTTFERLKNTVHNNSPITGFRRGMESTK